MNNKLTISPADDIDNIDTTIDTANNKKRKYRESVTREYENKKINYSTTRIRNFLDQLCSLKHNSRKYLYCKQYFTEEETNFILNWIEASVNTCKIIVLGDNGKRKQSEILLEYSNSNLSNNSGHAPPICLLEFMSVLYDNEEYAKFQALSLIESEKGCTKQDIHSDNSQTSYSPNNIKWNNSTWSIILALENNNNPTRLLLHTGEEKQITQGSFIMFRGDYAHAGCSYSQHNRRIHIAITPSPQMYDYDEVVPLDS
jgi:hypothetical protein